MGNIVLVSKRLAYNNVKKGTEVKKKIKKPTDIQKGNNFL